VTNHFDVTRRNTAFNSAHCPFKCFLIFMHLMAIWVVEFSSEGYKIRKIFA
jgi:hypothetical protein